MTKIELRRLSQLAELVAQHGVTHKMLRNAAGDGPKSDPDFPSPVGGSRNSGYLYETPAVLAWAAARPASMLARERDERSHRQVRAGLSIQSGLYFIRCGDFVKIGIAQNLGSRLSAIQVCNPYPVIMLASIIEPNGARRRALEQVWHAHWVGAHHRGEWFHATPVLLAAIAEIGAEQ